MKMTVLLASVAVGSLAVPVTGAMAAVEAVTAAVGASEAV